MRTAAFTRYNVNTLDTIGSRFIEISKLNANKEIITFPLFLKLEEVYTPFHSLIKKQNFSGMGERIAELDLIRDNSYYALRSVIRGFARLKNAKGDAAEELSLLFEQAGSIDGKTYAEEDSILDKLQSLMESDDAKVHITKLKVEEEVEQLFNDHRNFKDEYIKQNDANSELRQQSSASALRKDLEQALRNYYSFVFVMKEIQPWKDIYSDLTEIIKSTKIKKHKSSEADKSNENKNDN